MDMRFIKDQYIQPELRDKELYPTNASLERQLHFGMISSRKQENAISDKEEESSPVATKNTWMEYFTRSHTSIDP